MSQPVHPEHKVGFLKYVIIRDSTQTPLTNAGVPITVKLIAIFTFTAEGPGLVVADSMEATDLRIASALVNVWEREEPIIIC